VNVIKRLTEGSLKSCKKNKWIESAVLAIYNCGINVFDLKFQKNVRSVRRKLAFQQAFDMESIKNLNNLFKVMKLIFTETLVFYVQLCAP